jgi:hypothetical protein
MQRTGAEKEVIFGKERETNIKRLTEKRREQGPIFASTILARTTTPSQILKNIRPNNVYEYFYEMIED